MVRDRDPQPPGESDDHADFAARLRGGDPQAMQLLRERVRRILSHGRLRIPVAELDDLEQETMTQVWLALNRPTFDLGGGIWGFVEVVASRRCIDWLRSRRLVEPLTEALRDGSSDPLHRAMRRESTRNVSGALAALDAPCRELIALRIGEGLSFRELATRLGKSEEALRVQMYRCVRSARALWERRGPAPTAAEGESR
jgi:RNA polymerase sigma factor (sigma-70 family)